MNGLPRVLALLAATSRLLVCKSLFAESAAFDMTGPVLSGSVTRGNTTLPIAKVPNLAPGDRVVLRAEFPATQSARYLMVAVFLRGPTNPPPAAWFVKCETWSQSCVSDGLSLVVPKGAEQLLVLLAPRTGGDFKTLRNAVQGRPGAFVRAAQGLRQAALDRSRLDQYLEGLHELEAAGPAKLAAGAPLLARSLAIRVDEKCLDRIPALQVPCLTQGQDSLILNDGHSASMVATLTSGPASDLAVQAGSSVMMNSGAYLPFIGSLFDIARLLDSFHTAHYQYIPALTSLRGDRLVLMLNTPPSFHDPQSVLVTALPVVESEQPPPVRSVDSVQAYCADRSPLLLPVEGAPLLFSTGYAHELNLQVRTVGGADADLPVQADPKLGGLIVNTSSLSSRDIDLGKPAVLTGYWGFERFVGPTFPLTSARAQRWSLAKEDEAGLVAGREDTVHIQGGSVACLDDVRLRDPAIQEAGVPWKPVTGSTVELKLPLQQSAPGPLALVVSQYGAEPVVINLRSFSAAGHLDNFSLHAGDTTGVLKGSRLDQISTLQFLGYEFKTGAMTSSGGADQLVVDASDPQGVAALASGSAGKAKVMLKDGRSVTLDAVIDSPRPRASLIAKSTDWSSTAEQHHIKLGNPDEVPLDARLAFSIRTLWPATFSRDVQIEVATEDQSYSQVLSIANGGMTLENAHVALAALKPAVSFGPSAFGPLKFRLTANGVNGDWQPLATLVRLPILSSMTCRPEPDGGCQLSGQNLFLLDSIASNAEFHAPVRVPEGFSGFSLDMPRMAAGRFYVRLRDDPAVVNAVDLEPDAPASVTQQP